MSRPAGRRALVLCALPPLVLAALAAPAMAHVDISPATSGPGQSQLYTLQVPNETDDQAAVEVDVTLPKEFQLEVAEDVPGWETVVTKVGGVPVSVTWRGGRIPVDTYATFGLVGRNPDALGPLTWGAVQRYEHSTVSWTGAAGSDTPAPVVDLVPGGAAEAPTAAGPGTQGRPPQATPATPAAGPVAPAASATDPLARSRSAAGIALAVLALGLVLGPLALRALRARTTPDPAPEAVAPPAPPVGPGVPLPRGQDPVGGRRA